MEKLVGKIAGFGVPGLALLLAINATGLVGAAAITAALASLGPGGMIGGIRDHSDHNRYFAEMISVLS